MPAVSKAQQRFMGMVHAADKGETPASPEVAKVSKDMKDSDAKDFASTKHAGLPDKVREQIKSVVREVIREKNGISEMNVNDVHYRNIMKLYDRGGSFTKKKVAAVVVKNPNASRAKIEAELSDADYRDILEFEDELGLAEIREKYTSNGFMKESVNEAGKHKFQIGDYVKFAGDKARVEKVYTARNGKDMYTIGSSKHGTFEIEAEDVDESVNEVKYPTDLRVGSVILGQGFTRLKGIEGGRYYKIVAMDDTTATLTRTDPSGKTSSPTKVRHKLDSIEGGIKTAKRGDENGIVVIKESVNEEHDCGCNENHDCGCGGVHEHHINEDINADANGIAGLTASRATAVKDFIEKNNINSNKLYLSLKKGGLKDRMDFVTALVGKPGNPIQKKVIKQFSN